MPDTTGLVIAALVTIPSASVALTFAEVALPCNVVSELGQVGTTGATHRFIGEEVLRGLATVALKSGALLFVSVQPSLPLCAELLALKVGAAPAPSKQVALP
jgi:hypothetical protein